MKTGSSKCRSNTWKKDLSWERGISARLQEGIGAVLDFLDQHLPEQFRPLVEKGAGAATCARGAAAGKRTGTGPHLGRYGALIGKNCIDNIACPGDLKEPPGQAIITVKIGNKMY